MTGSIAAISSTIWSADEAPSAFLWKRQSRCSFALAFMEESGICRAPLVVFRQYAAHEFNAILWALLIFVTGLLFRRVWLVLRFWIHGSRIPGPPLCLFAQKGSRISAPCSLDSFTAFLGQAHREYGSVVRVWLGPTQLLVSVKDPELIQKLLVHAEDRLPLTGKAFQLAFGKSSLFVSSFAQVHRRRITLERQLNGKLLERVHSICLKVVDQIRYQANLLSDGLEFECKSVSQHLAFSVLGATLFGDVFLGWPLAKEFEEKLMMIAKEACIWAAYSVLPLWNKRFQNYKNTCAGLQSLTEQLIEERNKNQSIMSTESSSECFNSGIAVEYKGMGKDLVEDLIAGIVSSPESSSHFDLQEEIQGNIMGMMFHGCLTMSGVISGVLARLAQYPLIQEKVYEEIISVSGKSMPPSMADVQKMKLLLATVHESARLFPAGPLIQRCSLKNDIKLSKDIIVPAGAIIAVPVQLVQMDVCNWGEDADVFNPVRFLKCNESVYDSSRLSAGLNIENSLDEDSNTTFLEPSTNASFLPFGSGSRVCVGKKLAIIEMTGLLAALLRRYEIKISQGSEINCMPKMENLIMQPAPSPILKLVPRDC